jgi:GNAT superfamily N-acetyltransferase
MLHLRDVNHIAMLFVEGRNQRQGIGSGLVFGAEQYALARQPNLKVLTVASTPNAIEAYRAIGFVPVGSEQVLKGLRFVPMERKIGVGQRSRV